MADYLLILCVIAVLAPLAGSAMAGLFGQTLGRKGAHWVTITGVAIASIVSLLVFKVMAFDRADTLDVTLYQWAEIGGISFQIGFLIDRLTATMMVVVTFVSWMIHIYTIGYMHDDPGYQRFFSYISLFTFAMLMLIMANNFLQLFFGWEAVGLVSYLLIGFWFKRESAIFANMKAFLVNRVGDFGFLLGIAAVLFYTNSLHYAEVFAAAPALTGSTMNLVGAMEWSVLTVICISLFIGAMGKSAQVPLHVWLPDSMEGPTPISALIHAATMVTAGIFMVARMSPLYELSETALSFILVIGGTTAFFMGVLGLVQHDIKRVIAYSTLSQLGYMTVALGASAYSAAIFHLVTHAFFKALLFLAAGSVIIAMHHVQDMRKMGRLNRFLPMTWLTMLAGSIALIGVPGTSGFFSKDAIIEAVHLSELQGATYAYYCVLFGVFITALYTFRMVFLVFHGRDNVEQHTKEHLFESPPVVLLPLIILAIPSLFLGLFTTGPVLFSDYFADSIYVAPAHDVMAELGQHYHGVIAFMLHGLMTPPVWLALAGVVIAWLLYVRFPAVPARLAAASGVLYRVLLSKYGFDDFNQTVFARGTRGLGRLLWQVGDVRLIDGLVVNGSAHSVRLFSGFVRHAQSGYLYHYAFAMIIGLLVLLGLFVQDWPAWFMQAAQ